MLAPSADANTSAGAPPWICCTSADDAAKLNVTVVPGFAFWKSAPILVNASVSDAAADTVIVPDDLLGLRGRRRAPLPSPTSPIAAIDHRDDRDLNRSLHTSAPARHSGRGTSTTTFVDFTTADREIAGLDAELVGGLAGHQRRDPVRAGLDVHHRDQAVLLDLGDDARETGCAPTRAPATRRPAARSR